MKIYPVIRKVITGGGGSASGFIASVVQAGVSFANRFTLLGGTAAPGVQVTADRFTFQGPTQATGIDTELLGVTGTAVNPEHTPAVDVDASLREVAASSTQQIPAFTVEPSLREVAAMSHTQVPGIDTELLAATGTLAQPSSLPAFAATTVINEFHLDSLPAAEIVQVTYNLTRRVGGNASADVTGTWTNRANAQGIHDGTSATSAGATLAGSRKMRLDYANHTDKTALTISLVRLHVYASKSVDALAVLGSILFTYNIGAGEVNLEAAITADFNSLTTPRTYDLTTPVGGDWAKLDALQVFALHTYTAASLAVTVNLDAVELEVVASATQIP